MLALWLYRYRKDLHRPPDPDTQQNLDFGIAIGNKAHKLFPSGQPVSTVPWNTAAAAAQTKKLIRSGVKIIFEACAEHPIDKTHARIDILLQNEHHSWALYEVKASTRVLYHHIDDLAFQWYVFRAAGFQIQSAYIIHLKPEQTQDITSLTENDIFVTTDVTERVLEQQRTTFKLSFELGVMLRQSSPPKCPPGPQCVNPFPCEFCHICWQDLSTKARADIEAAKTKQ